MFDELHVRQGDGPRSGTSRSQRDQASRNIRLKGLLQPQGGGLDLSSNVTVPVAEIGIVELGEVVGLTQELD